MAGTNPKVTFQLDTSAAGTLILQQLMMPVVKRSGEAIGARANGMVSSMSRNPPRIEVEARVGTIRRGERAIAYVKVVADDPHAAYVGRMALSKSRDAGRLN